MVQSEGGQSGSLYINVFLCCLKLCWIGIASGGKRPVRYLAKPSYNVNILPEQHHWYEIHALASRGGHLHPLLKGFFPKVGNGGSWIKFAYEPLAEFGYNCGN
ncbi:hypothetical protein FEM48_Zijuj06G0210300 [Ziziphus jujuba var. spinosa]|uniref:Uncharacterized protein n=1 Tax=Ziziphus jujuba var. spinosa TaxID=714518 RepID=A0A978VBL5_ZIZJJ|nr:hypothetical protein FEM48_Zijuj06G0210300 [Ziziphus jujuba var. spinosa]